MTTFGNQLEKLLLAQNAFKSGNYVTARNIFEKITNQLPEEQRLPALLMLSEACDFLGDQIAASKALDRVLLEKPNDSALLYKRGILALRTDHQQLSKAAEAEEFFRQSILLDPYMAETHYHLAIAMQVQTRHAEGIPHFLRAIELSPNMTKAYFELAKSYSAADRLKEAEIALEKVLTTEPDHIAAKKDLDDLKRHLSNDTAKIRYVRYPNLISNFSNLKESVKNHLLNSDYPIILNEDSKVVTFGSCFAGNIARALREAGVNAKNTTFGEFVNSTFANRHYIDWIISGMDNPITRSIAEYHAGDPNFPLNRETHLELLSTADIVVMTVGVAACFFKRGTDELVIPRPSSFNLRAILNESEFRTTTVEQNTDNLSYIINKIRRINSSANIAVTLSPVPLTATFEYESALIADCVSKSTLRIAVDQILRRNPNIIYWPSFELVKWAGPYIDNVYGEEDASTIHVSERIIKLIVELFIETLSDGRILCNSQINSPS